MWRQHGGTQQKVLKLRRQTLQRSTLTTQKTPLRSNGFWYFPATRKSFPMTMYFEQQQSSGGGSNNNNNNKTLTSPLVTLIYPQSSRAKTLQITEISSKHRIKSHVSAIFFCAAAVVAGNRDENTTLPSCYRKCRFWLVDSGEEPTATGPRTTLSDNNGSPMGQREIPLIRKGSIHGIY